MPFSFPNAARVLAGSVLIVLIAGPVAAQVDGSEDATDQELPENPYERLAEVQRRQAETALEVDALEASAVEVRGRLDQVEAWVVAQERVVEAAQAELVAATLAAQEARADEEAKAAELAALEELMATIAVEAFIRPQVTAGLELLISQDMDAAAKGEVMLRAKSDRDHDVAALLAEAEAALRELRVVADREAARTKLLADDAASELDELNRARLEQAVLAKRIMADLETTAAQLDDLGGAEAEAVLAVQRETEAVLARVGGGASISLVNVRGIRVHSEIAPAVEALLAAAEADGVALSGWGHRTTDQQIELRRQHCGGEGITEAEAIYLVPSSSCSPPTARPGTSMHELGLAIDFTFGGGSIGTRQSPGYRWLAEHAGDYGLRNLPSEPWHWSVNGD